MESLNGLDGVRAYGEIFLGKRGSEEKADPLTIGATTYADWVDRFPDQFRLKRVWSYLDFLRRDAGSDVAFKLMYNQIKLYPEIFAAVPLQRMPVIHLVRGNHFDTMLSGYRLRKLGVKHSTLPIKEEKVTIPVHEAMKILRKQVRELKLAKVWLKIITNPVLRIYYEDLIENPSSSIHRICEFIGTSAPDNSSSDTAFKKINTKSYRETIGNYDELKFALAKTPFQKYLSE